MLIQLRGGTEAEWTAKNPTLRARECGVTTDTHGIKVGDGQTAWNDLPYAGGSGGGGGVGLIFQFKGSVPTYGDLPAEPASADIWLVEATGHWWQWQTTTIVEMVEGQWISTVTGEWVDLGRVQGPPGDDGLPGEDGQPGQDGQDGADGQPGPPGASAYQVAVANGFVGTQAAWLASLVGADSTVPGPAGADGVGVPAGGTVGQALVKASGDDYDTEWATVEGGTGGGLPTREDEVVTTDSIADAASWTGLATLAAGYRLLAVETDVAARVRVYDSAASRTADAARAIGTDPTGAHGCLLDLVTTASALVWWMNPVVDGYTIDETGDVPVSVTNLSGSTGTVTVTATWVRSE